MEIKENNNYVLPIASVYSFKGEHLFNVSHYIYKSIFGNDIFYAKYNKKRCKNEMYVDEDEYFHAHCCYCNEAIYAYSITTFDEGFIFCLGTACTECKNFIKLNRSNAVIYRCNKERSLRDMIKDSFSNYKDYVSVEEYLDKILK